MPDERVGLFTPEQEEKLAKIADEAVKLNNPLAEGIDGFVLKHAIRALDNLVFEKIPQQAQEVIEPILDDIVTALPEPE